MPNVGKSTLLNALRNAGIRGRKYSYGIIGSLRTYVIAGAWLLCIPLPNSNAKSAQNLFPARADPRRVDAVKIMSRPIGLRLRLAGGNASLHRERRQRCGARYQVGAYRYRPMNTA